MKRFFLLGIIVFTMLSNPLNAQISEGGVPPSFTYLYDILKFTEAPVIIYPDFDAAQLAAQDDDKSSCAVGRAIPVKLSIENSGEWLTLPDGTRIWRLNIKSPGAIAITLIYDKFQLPEGGKLFIYNKDKTHILGAYTAKNNRKQKKFATEFVAGDDIVIEYVAPVSHEDKEVNQPIISISNIVYGYNHLTVTNKSRLRKNDPWFGNAGSCQVNINCSPEGDNWQTQKKGVARFLYLQEVSGNLTYKTGTGSMVNNTAQDLTPYFLTAGHNVNNLIIDFSTMVFYFHYEAPGCENIAERPAAKTLVGADLLVECPASGGSDGALLRLYDNIPLEYGVYFNGWDRRNNPATSGVSIHHPAGDIKKISTYTASAVNESWNANGITGAPNAHWLLQFSQSENGWGTMENGSDGSPLFNQNGLIVGTYTGGSSGCANKSGDAYYGKLWYHWDQHPDPGSHMRPYLDPLNTGQTTLPGTFVQQQQPNANFTASNEKPYVLTSVTYTDHSSFATSWEWTFEGGEPSSFVGKEPPAIKYSSTGSFTTTLTINKGIANERTAAKVITVVEKGINPTAPTANFTFDKYGGSVFMTQNFDDRQNPVAPNGWALENHGTSANEWKRDNPADAEFNFNHIEPSNNYSLICESDPNNIADSWLKTPEYALPQNAYLDFWALYDGSKIKGGVISVNISTDGGTTWSELWTNGPENNYNEWGLGWRPVSIMLSDYGGQNVKIGFRYYGQGGTHGGFDGIKVGTVRDPNQTITIGKGGYISLTDLSLGYPTVYKWQFPGAETTSSDKQNPDTIRYMTPGLYDVILTVENLRGTNTRTFTNAVEVVWLVPDPGYHATYTDGYTLTSGGPFAPGKARVKIADNSNKYPESWKWKFDGAIPVSSTEQNPGWIEYNNPGIFPLNLRAANPGGVGEIYIPQFAKIGYGIPGNIWNMLGGENGMAGLKSEYGHLTGTTNNIASMYAEKFEKPVAPGYIKSVDIMFHVNSATNGNLTVKLCAATADGLPLTTSTLATATLPVTSINPNGYTTVTFTDSVFITGPFFIVVEGFRNVTDYDLYITSSPNRGVYGKNTAYVYYYYYLFNIVWLSWGWAPIPDVFDGMNVSLNIAPEFSYTNAYTEIDGDSIFTMKNIDPTVNTVNVKSNKEWEVKSLNNWITLAANPPYSGDGSFTFTVSDNVYNTRKGLIEITSLSGYFTKYVVVQQAGPAPDSVIATIVDETKGKIELTWNMPDTKTIFDNSEKHSAWAVNSPGLYGWSYIDGDGAATKGMGQPSYPNKAAPMAFQVFNLETYPGSKPTSHFSKSGNQILACPAAVGVPNDDWLISPELNFKEAFTFSFWAKSYSSSTSTYDEKIEVAYSTTGKLATDFTTVVATEHVTDKLAWANFEYTIPANAKYVAIHCISNNQHMLMLDDLFIGLGTAPQEDPGFLPFDSIYKLSYINDVPTVDVPVLPQSLHQGDDIEVAVRFEPIDLVPYHNKKIRSVDIYVVAQPKDGIILNIRSGNELIHSQKVTGLSIGGGTSIDLDKDVYINAVQDMYIGYTYQHNPNSYVAAAELGSAVVGKSDLIKLGDGNFESVYDRMRLNCSWLIKTNVENAIDYKIYRDDVEIATVNDTVFNDQIMTKNACYKVSTIYDNSMESVKSNDSCVILSAIPKPDEVTDLSAVYDSDNTIDLSWSAVNLAAKYNVYRNGVLVKDGNLTTSYTDPQLTPGQYCYKVTVINAVGTESDSSNIACETVVKPMPINDLATVYDNDHTISLSWTAGTTATGYNIYRNGIKIKDANTTTSYTDSQLTPGQYCYRVTAINVVGTESDSSNIACETVVKPTPINDLAAVYDNDNTISLSWTAGITATGYNIYRNGIKIKDANTTTSYTDSQLTPGQYCYRVTVVNIVGTESDSSNIACETVVKPVPINDLATTYDNDNTISLSWTASATATGYNIYRNGIKINDANTTTSYNDPQLTPGEYCYTVTAVNSIGMESELSNAACETVIKPTPINDLTAVYDNNNTISLNWSAGATATSYNIYRNGVKIKDGNTTTSYNDPQLTPGQYCYTVTAVNSIGMESELSNAACETVIKPTPINDLTAVYDNDNTISLSWSAGATATSYNIYRNGVKIKDANTTTSYTDPQLAPGQYCYTVTAVNSVGTESELSNAACETVKPLPIADLAAVYDNDNTISLSWTASATATGYNIYRNGVKIKDANTTTSYTDSQLAPGQYCYTVTAVNSVGTESEFSNAACETVKPLPIADLAAVYDNDNTISLSWTASATATGYNIYRNGVKIKDSNTTTSYNDPQLTPGQYCYTVTAVNSIGMESELSNAACTHVTNIELSPSNLEMIKGSTFVLKLTIYTGNDAKVIWSTSDPEIATVDNNGKVTAIGYGSAVITVSTEDNSLTAICNVKVSTINTNNDIRPSQGFSPDGDGENDYWIIDGIEKHLKNDLYIFDRGGKLHYSVKNYKNDWDGIANTGPYKGRKVPPGTYYYVLKIDDVQMKRSFIVIKY